MNMDASSSLAASEKWAACFNEEGRIITVAVIAAQQISGEEAAPAKVRRLDSKEFKVWSPLLCSWSDVFFCHAW